MYGFGNDLFAHLTKLNTIDTQSKNSRFQEDNGAIGIIESSIMFRTYLICIVKCRNWIIESSIMVRTYLICIVKCRNWIIESSIMFRTYLICIVKCRNWIIESSIMVRTYLICIVKCRNWIIESSIMVRTYLDCIGKCRNWIIESSIMFRTYLDCIVKCRNWIIESSIMFRTYLDCIVKCRKWIIESSIMFRTYQIYVNFSVNHNHTGNINTLFHSFTVLCEDEFFLNSKLHCPFTNDILRRLIILLSVKFVENVSISILIANYAFIWSVISVLVFSFVKPNPIRRLS